MRARTDLWEPWASNRPGPPGPVVAGRFWANYPSDFRRDSHGLSCSTTVASVDATQTKKADVIERPKAFHHVGLLVNEPLGSAELLPI